MSRSLKEGSSVSTYPTSELVGATIESLAWIAGRWATSEEGTKLEEIWSPPDAGIMMGMFRWLDGDEPRFYEFMLLKPSAAGLELHIKHFTPDLVGWEAKDASTAFDLVQIGDREAVFHPRAEESSGWAVYRIADDGWLEFEEVPEGDASETALRLRFAPASGTENRRGNLRREARS
jgi:hypothetical protein